MLGAIIAGTIAGFAVMGACASKREKEERKSNQGCSYSSHYSVSYGGNDYEKKVDFFDAYRSLDNYLASFVGENYRGIIYLRSGFIGYAKMGYHKLYEIVDKLNDCRKYRNYIGHDKSKWSTLKDPEDWMEPFLRSMLSVATNRSHEIVVMVEEGKSYLNSHY